MASAGRLRPWPDPGEVIALANTFQVDVVSPEETVWSGTATFLLAKTPEGDSGSWPTTSP